MRTAATLILMTLLAALPACGGGDAEVPDRAAIDAAIQAYVEQRSMDLAVDRYESFDRPDGDRSTATAIVRMKYAGEGYAGLTQAFRFDLRRAAGGAWEVVSHEKR